MIDVTLTWSELTTAALIGVRRQVQNLSRKLKDRYGASADDGWSLHVEGACGEMAVAKAIGRYWSGNMGDLSADDVGDLQVRTAGDHNRRLILHPEDPDDRIFVFVTGRAPSYRIHGWICARDGKRREWWSDPSRQGRPAYFVPGTALHPIATLKDLLP